MTTSSALPIAPILKPAPAPSPMILGALILTGTLASVHAIQQGRTPDVVRLLIGTLLAGVMLTTLAQVQPDLAKSLAVLALVAEIAGAGPELWTGLAKTVNAPHSSSVAATSTATTGDGVYHPTSNPTITTA